MNYTKVMYGITTSILCAILMSMEILKKVRVDGKLFSRIGLQRAAGEIRSDFSGRQRPARG